ncbi:hypothetical protein GTO89_09720 [Heliobacterium gestii]|uniref:Transcription regulator TrmB N-terminal domain-containing protein n=1 Tax=Heliomicrobium gestii TaxID=2699 RepID=A0A845LKD0_HELGE|nr:TrmB family transcriptional regulator [Heliomicrobium gestii]MBM7867872.1 hypothetical protein [Heliomicrobium gestii]MZP43316.1 hypothetical protein [Heliomicrobium gestii]
MIDEKLVSLLQALGFSRYEGLAYLALLKKHPATGYEISRLSGVPHPKIYETMPRLLEKQAVLLLPGEPARYRPQPPETVLDHLRQSFLADLARAQMALERWEITTPPPSPALLTSGEEILKEAETLLLTAEKRVWIQGPASFLQPLDGTLAHRRRLGYPFEIHHSPGEQVLLWAEEGPVITASWSDSPSGMCGSHSALQALARQAFPTAAALKPTLPSKHPAPPPDPIDLFAHPLRRLQ